MASDDFGTGSPAPAGSGHESAQAMGGLDLRDRAPARDPREQSGGRHADRDAGSDPLGSEPQADAGAPGGPADEVAEGTDPGRRRKLILAGILAAALVIVGAVAAWYLINRKPLTEIPILGIEAVPNYQGSINGVGGPLGVAASADGERIYVTQSAGEAVTRIFNTSGAEIGRLTPPKSEGKSHQPVYVAVNPANGEVAVSDRITREIYIYGPDGTYSRRFEPKYVGSGKWQPLAVAYDKAGNLYVSDTSGRQTLREFGPDGLQLRELGSPGDTSFANGIVIDEAGNVAVSDSNNGRVIFYGADGAVRAQINRGAGTGELSMPRGLAVASGNKLFVVDTINQHVQVYNIADLEQGVKFIGSMGTEGMADGQFAFPNGAATDSRDRVFITDRANNRVQIWSN